MSDSIFRNWMAVQYGEEAFEKPLEDVVYDGLLDGFCFLRLSTGAGTKRVVNVVNRYLSTRSDGTLWVSRGRDANASLSCPSLAKGSFLVSMVLYHHLEMLVQGSRNSNIPQVHMVLTMLGIKPEEIQTAFDQGFFTGRGAKLRNLLATAHQGGLKAVSRGLHESGRDVEYVGILRAIVSGDLPSLLSSSARRYAIPSSLVWHRLDRCHKRGLVTSFKKTAALTPLGKVVLATHDNYEAQILAMLKSDSEVAPPQDPIEVAVAAHDKAAAAIHELAQVSEQRASPVDAVNKEMEKHKKYIRECFDTLLSYDDITADDLRDLKEALCLSVPCFTDTNAAVETTSLALAN